MSDSAIIVTELTVTEQDAAARAAAAASWLLDQGITKRNPHPDPLHSPSQYLAGPGAASAAPAFEQIAELANAGIDLIDRRQVHDPGGNYEPPTCPNCATPLDEDTHFALIEPWLEHDEPETTCNNCGATARLGDWRGRWVILVANLAVRFNNWPALNESFVNELCAHLGPRCRLIYQRI